VSFDYLANLRKLKKKTILEGWAGVMKRGVQINEKPNQGVRETKKVGMRCSRQSAHRWRLGCQPNAPVAFYSQEDLLVLVSVRG
jgi:hypothetical protein